MSLQKEFLDFNDRIKLDYETKKELADKRDILIDILQNSDTMHRMSVNKSPGCSNENRYGKNKSKFFLTSSVSKNSPMSFSMPCFFVAFFRTASSCSMVCPLIACGKRVTIIFPLFFGPQNAYAPSNILYI